MWRARDWSRPSGVKWFAIFWDFDGTWCPWEFGLKPECMNYGKMESHKTEIRHKTAAGRMAGNSETKIRINFISYGRKPQTYMFERITDLSCSHAYLIFRTFFPSFVTAMSSPSDSEIPAAFPKSRCPPRS